MGGEAGSISSSPNYLTAQPAGQTPSPKLHTPTGPHTIHTHTHIHTKHTHTGPHTIHTYTHIGPLSQHTQRYAHTQSSSLTHPHTPTHTEVLTHSKVHTHTHTHTHAQRSCLSHTHIRKHTHTPKVPLHPPGPPRTSKGGANTNASLPQSCVLGKCMLFFPCPAVVYLNCSGKAGTIISETKSLQPA